MTGPCDLRHHAKACVITRAKYRRPACASCEDGVLNTKEMEKAAPPGPREAIPTKPEPAQPKKETAVATKGKEAILRRITNEKSCSRGRLTCFCSVTAAQLDAAVKELEAEGKIKSWPKGRGSLYTLPDAPDPRGASAPAKKSSATPPIKTHAKAERPVPAPRRSGPDGLFSDTIADLEKLRSVLIGKIGKIDVALEGLRALA